MKTSRKKLAAITALLILSLTLMAPAAFAQSSREGYLEQGPSAVNQVTGGGGDGGGGDAGDPRGPQTSSGGELPFTGLDVGLIAIAGVSLLLMGFAMRRFTRAPDAA